MCSLPNVLLTQHLTCFCLWCIVLLVQQEQCCKGAGVFVALLLVFGLAADPHSLRRGVELPGYR